MKMNELLSENANLKDLLAKTREELYDMKLKYYQVVFQNNGRKKRSYFQSTNRFQKKIKKNLEKN
jgi:hypothetical protein